MIGGKETRAIVCGHVFREERRVKLIVRHHDGVWQFTCGDHDHPEDLADFEVVGANHIFERQENLSPIMDLLPGRLAEMIDGEWQITAHDS
jgi:hypothetical protein